MYEKSYREQFEKADIWYEHRLIDDMVAQASIPLAYCYTQHTCLNAFTAVTAIFWLAHGSGCQSGCLYLQQPDMIQPDPRRSIQSRAEGSWCVPASLLE